MQLTCTISRGGGDWIALHESRDVGRVEVHAATRAEAIEKITGEIRYRLELCPCSGETYQHIQVEVREA